MLHCQQILKYFLTEVIHIKARFGFFYDTAGPEKYVRLSYNVKQAKKEFSYNKFRFQMICDSVSDSKKVYIIGSGIVGLCCALHLQRDGWDITIIDKVGPGESCSYGHAGVL